MGGGGMETSSQHARQLPADPHGHAEAVQEAPPATLAGTLATTNGVVPTTTNTGTGAVEGEGNASMVWLPDQMHMCLHAVC